MRRRPSFGPATFYVATLVVVLVAVGLFAVARSQERPARSPAPTTAPGALSPLDEALKGIRDDGTWSKETALAVFAAAFGPLPGVPTPRADSSYRSGSLAIRMVQAHWAELTDEQKRAIKDYIGPTAAKVMPASYNAQLAALEDQYQQIVDADVAEVSAAFGRGLGIPFPVIIGGSENGGAWAWTTGDWTGSPPGGGATTCSMTVPPSTVNDPSRQQYLRWIFMHEVWHCFQYRMISYATYTGNPPWVMDGEANWVASAITGGVGVPPPAWNQWLMYVMDPGKPLFSRSYDGMGFYSQLAQNNIDPWKVLQDIVQGGSSDAAFEASGASKPTFTDRYGGSWFRDPKPSADWTMSDAFGIPPAAYRAVPASIQITDGAEGTISAKPNAGGIADVHTTAFITHFEAVGVGRVADPDSVSLDRVVRSGTLDLCTNPGGDCTCPPGSAENPTPPERAPQTLRAAASGEEHSTSVMGIRGISKDDWCKTKRSPAPSAPQGEKPCKEGCGGSNGDPHMRTVDGFRYDLQAAGEYVLLRAADGSVEVQGRQEQPSSKGNVTIGTAVAVKVNGHRVGFYAVATGAPEIHVDGAVVDATKAGSADLGAGAKLAAYQRGYELDLPDGTKVWALSVGKWGINLLVLPSASLRSTGVGLIAHVPAGAGLKVPSPPDGSTFPKPADSRARYHDLYEVLAPGWRVTAATSLFDYAAGTTTDSFTLAGFPPEEAPQSIDDLDPAAVLSAKTTCAKVTDPDLADQCAYDVAVTGSTEYVTLYSVTDTFQTQGTTSLSQPPSGATPSPPAVGIPSGINLVADHLAGIGGSVLGPDGTLYVYIAEQGAGFGDFKPMLLAVDSATGKVKQKVAAASVGALAWGAGSVWAGEFDRTEAVWCEVSRLDPVSLAVLAKVPTVCSSQGRSDFGTVGDAIWFADRTGVDANGSGGHFRRIDPATNKVDTAPSGNLDLPVTPEGVGVPGVSSILASTSAGVVIGDRRHGFYALTAGSGSFEKIDLPANASGTLFPAGSGIWVQTEIGTSAAPEGVVTFASSDPASDMQLGIDGDLVGADDSAVYATPPKEDLDPDALWRHPSNGGAATKLAVTGDVPNGFGGTRPLLYRDQSLPLLIRDRLLVKLWQTASPTSTDGTGAALVIQAIPLP